MIDLHTRIKWTPKALNNRPEWDKKAMKRALPYIRLMQWLLAQIKIRVITKQMHAGNQKFSKYKDAQKKGFVFWVSPRNAQASAGVIARRMVGTEEWLGYKSGREYKRHVAGTEHKNFVDTGEMWRSLRIRVRSHYSLRAAFYGSSMTTSLPQGDRFTGKSKVSNVLRKKRNADKAYYQAQNEAYGLLWVSDEEIAKVMKEWSKMYSNALGALIRESDVDFKLTRQVGKLQRGIKRGERALHKFSKK